MTDGETLETVEMEVSEEDILYYLVDENDVEVGFVVMENGCEVECYYEGCEDVEFAVVEDAPTATTGTDAHDVAEGHGYLYKMAQIAGHEGNKVRTKAEKQLDKARGAATEKAKQAKDAATEKAAAVKAKAEEDGTAITREEMAEFTQDLNVIAHEGAETAKELKDAYDDIMDSFGFLLPKGKRRR